MEVVITIDDLISFLEVAFSIAITYWREVLIIALSFYSFILKRKLKRKPKLKRNKRKPNNNTQGHQLKLSPDEIEHIKLIRQRRNRTNFA